MSNKSICKHGWLESFACRDISYSEDPRVRLKVCETTGGTQHGSAWHGGNRRDINRLERFTSSPRAHPLWSWFPFSRKKPHHSHTALFGWIRQEKCKKTNRLDIWWTCERTSDYKIHVRKTRVNETEGPRFTIYAGHNFKHWQHSLVFLKFSL